MTLPSNSISSPAFAEVHTLGRWLSLGFTVLFWIVILYLAVAVLLFAPAPVHTVLNWEDAMLPLAGHTPGERLQGTLSLAVSVLPELLLLHHARRLFGCFAQGQVFTAAAVAHIRAAGAWLVVSAVAAMIAKSGLLNASGAQGNAGFV